MWKHDFLIPQATKPLGWWQLTDEHVKAIREMANGGDENAESLVDLFEECNSRMDFEI